jgi:hypothetical protein
MVEETGVPGGNHRYVTRAENPFYTNLSDKISCMVSSLALMQVLQMDLKNEQKFIGT